MIAKNDDQGTPRSLLGSLGRDEMNLAEFPISLLADRVPKGQTQAIYQDVIQDELTGRTLVRKLTISVTVGESGLTTAADDEVILALIQLTRLKGDFSDCKVEFTRQELIKLLGWQDSGLSYQRLEKSLDRWTSVFLKYENAWRDNRLKKWTSQGFHIIDQYELNDSRSDDAQGDQALSHIIWNRIIFESFQSGYLKPLDYDFCMGLATSVAKRMYRFLDKRFHHKLDLIFDIKEFAHSHIGLAKSYEGVAHLRRKLTPAIEELERVGFLAPLADGRFFKKGRDWVVRFVRGGSAATPPAPASPRELPLFVRPAADAVDQQSPAVAKLIGLGVTPATASKLVAEHPADLIESKVEIFEWMVQRKDLRVSKSPAGYLVKSIEGDYSTPKGFVSRAERQAREEGERRALEELQQARLRADRERREELWLSAYWDGLDRAEQDRIDRDSIALTDEQAKELERGPFRRAVQKNRRNSYIRSMIIARGGSIPQD